MLVRTPIPIDSLGSLIIIFVAFLPLCVSVKTLHINILILRPLHLNPKPENLNPKPLNPKALNPLSTISTQRLQYSLIKE